MTKKTTLNFCSRNHIQQTRGSLHLFCKKTFLRDATPFRRGATNVIYRLESLLLTDIPTICLVYSKAVASKIQSHKQFFFLSFSFTTLTASKWLEIFNVTDRQRSTVDFLKSEPLQKRFSFSKKKIKQTVRVRVLNSKGFNFAVRFFMTKKLRSSNQTRFFFVPQITQQKVQRITNIVIKSGM